MSENQNRGSMDFAKYDSMETQELEEILRLDAQMPKGQESDGELILHIMEVLAKRKSSHTGKTALEAYESFKQNYMPETEPDESAVPVKTKKCRPRWLRSLTAAAAVLAVLLVGSVTASAFGFNIWKTVVQWTQETFHFGEWGESDSDNNLPYKSLQEALEKGNTPSWLVPTYIPDGYRLMDIKTEQTPVKKVYTAKYKNGESVLVIKVRSYLEGDPVYVEQNEGLIEEYKISDITYYLFSNLEHNRAAWLYESYECDISGEVTIEELKKMIDSIQKG